MTLALVFTLILALALALTLRTIAVFWSFPPVFAQVSAKAGGSTCYILSTVSVTADVRIGHSVVLIASRRKYWNGSVFAVEVLPRAKPCARRKAGRSIGGWRVNGLVHEL